MFIVDTSPDIHRDPFIPDQPPVEGLKVNAPNTAPQVEEAPNTQKDPAATKQTCVDLIHQGLAFGTLSSQLWDHLTAQDSSMATEIASFKEKYAPYIELLKGTTWKDYVATLEARIKANPQDLSAKQESKNLATFRKDAVHLQEDLTRLAAHTTGIHFGKWVAFGTAGNTSDVDNVYLDASRKTPQTDQMLIKLFADTAYTYLFGEESLSGLQLDVETYLEHPGSSDDMRKALSGPLSNSVFYLELSMVQLAMRKNALGEDEDGWLHYKEHCQKFHEGPFKKTLEDICSDVELLHAQTQVDILCKILKQHGQEIDSDISQDLSESNIKHLQEAAKQTVGPEVFQKAYKQAAMAYKAPRLLRLSEQMDEDQRKINQLSNALPPIQKHQINLLQTRLIACALLRNTFFDESYFSGSAYNIVCDNEGGQLSRRRDEQILSTIEQHREAIRLPPQAISRKTRRPRTALECLISANENTAQFYHYSHPATISERVKTAQDLAIDSSKYAERITSSALSAIDLFEQQLQKPNPQNFVSRVFQKASLLTSDTPKQVEHLQKMRAEIEALHKQATALESCKRQVELNDETTRTLLKEALLEETFGPKPTKPQVKAVETAIDNVLAKFKEGGKYFQQELSLTEKYNIYLVELGKQKCFQTHLSLREPEVKPPSELETAQRIPKAIGDYFANLDESGANVKWIFRRLSFEGEHAILVMAERALRAVDPTRQITEQEVAIAAAKRLQSFLEGHETVYDAQGKELAFDQPSWLKALDSQLQQHVKMPHALELMTWSPQVDTIIRARVGFSRLEDPKIQALHTQARDVTMLKSLQLGSTDDIHRYFQGIQDVGNRLLQFTQTSGVVVAAKKPEGMDFALLWKNTA